MPSSSSSRAGRFWATLPERSRRPKAAGNRTGCCYGWRRYCRQSVCSTPPRLPIQFAAPPCRLTNWCKHRQRGLALRKITVKGKSQNHGAHDGNQPMQVGYAILGQNCLQKLSVFPESVRLGYCWLRYGAGSVLLSVTPHILIHDLSLILCCDPYPNTGAGKDILDHVLHAKETL